MALGNLAQDVIFKYKGTSHPRTGREPVIVGELINALNRYGGAEADHVAHNFKAHGAITNRDICEPGSACRERGLG